MKIRKTCINGTDYFVCNLPKDRNGKFRILYARTERELLEKYNDELQKMKLKYDGEATIETLFRNYLNNTPLMIAERDMLLRNAKLLDSVKDLKVSNITKELIDEWIVSLGCEYRYKDISAICKRIKKVFDYGNINVTIPKPSREEIARKNNEKMYFFKDLITDEIRLELLNRNCGISMYLYVYDELSNNKSLFIKAKALQYMTYENLMETKETGVYEEMKFPDELLNILENYAQYTGLKEKDYLFANSAENAVDGTTVLRYMRELFFLYGLPTNVVFENAFLKKTAFIDNLEIEITTYINTLEIQEQKKELLLRYFDEYKNMLKGKEDV